MTSLSASSLTSLYNQLADFANSDNFWEIFNLAFGTQYDLTLAQLLRSQWQNGIFSQLPQVEVISSSILGYARGAYASSNNTIYLSDRFIAESNNYDLAAVVLEEIGHFVDSLVNQKDTSGDEGELFSDLVRDIRISNSELQRLTAEDDTTTIIIGAQTLTVEQSSSDLGFRQGYGYLDDSVDYIDSGDFWTFSTYDTGTINDYIRISSGATNVDLVLEIYNVNNILVGRSDVNNSTNNLESLSLRGLAPGTYRASVYNYYGTAIGYPYGANYRLELNVPFPRLPDLTPHQPLGWSDEIIVSTRSGTSTDTTLITTADFLYIDWSAINAGSGATNQGFQSRLFLDGQVVGSWTSNILNSLAESYVVDFTLNPLTAGLHSLSLQIDYLNSVREAQEGNNIFTKSFTVYASGSDRLESNNTFATAKNLGIVTGFRRENNLSIHTSTDIDWFSFQISGQTTSQDYVGIDFDDSGDLDIALYNAQGQIIDYSIGTGNSETISLSSLTQGAYYLQVYGYAGSINDYNLRLNTPGSTIIAADRFEANNTRQTATNLKDFDWGQQVGAKSWENLTVGVSDQDWFKFDLAQKGTAGNYVAIAFNTYQGDLDLDLYNTAGTIIKSAKGFRNTESITLDGLVAGTYYARVTGYAGKTNANYSLFINTPGSDRFEENDSLAQAKLLTRTKTQQTWESLSVNDQDWFKINLPSSVTGSDFISVDFDHSQGDVDLELYNTSGTKINESTGVGNTERISLAGLSGDYYIKVFGYSNATNPNYSLTVSAPISSNGDWLEANNTQATAKDLNLQFSQQLQAGQQFIELGTDPEKPLSIHNFNDVDWFKFTIATAGKQGDFASISFSHTVGDLDFYLYDSPTATTALRKSEGIANTHTIDLQGLTAKTYYLKVSGYGGATNSDYSLSVKAPFVQETGDWSEANNTVQQAKDLGTISDFYSKGNLSIHQAADVDWFKFTLAATGGIDDRIGINFNHGQGDLDVELYNANGITLRDQSTGVSGTEEISLNMLAAGTYYLKVYGYSGATNSDYNLFINAPANVNGDWAEQNNTAATARDLRNVEGFQTWNTLSIHNASDVDWFKFTMLGAADANDFVSIAFDQTLGDLELYVLDAAGNRLLDAAGKERKSETIDNVEQVSLKGLAAGTYLIQVKGYNGAKNPTYQLAVNAPDSNKADWAEDNNSRATAEDLQEVQGTQILSGLSIHQSGDEDWFQFKTVGTGVAGHSIGIDFDRNAGDLQLALYKAGQTTPILTSTSNSNREQISLAGLAAGTYSVRVYGATATTTNPSYSLIIDAPQAAKADWIDKKPQKNDSLVTAYDLRNIDGSIALDGLSVHSTTDADWFKVVVHRKTNSDQFARIDFNHNEGDLQLELFNAAGTKLAVSNTTENFEQISLAGRDVGSYYIKVSGATNPDYRLVIVGVQKVKSDRLEANNNPLQAHDLRGIANSISLLEYERGKFPGPFNRESAVSFAENLRDINLPPELYQQAGFSSNGYTSNLLRISNPSETIRNIANYPQSSSQSDPPQQQLAWQQQFEQQQQQLAWQQQFEQQQQQLARQQQLEQQQQLVWQQQQYSQIISQDNFSYLNQPQFGPDVSQLFQQVQSFQNSESFSQSVSTVIPYLSIDSSADQDWFKFNLPLEGEEGQFIGLNFDNDLGNLQIELFEAFNTTTNTTEAQYQKFLVDRSNGNGDSELINLAGLGKGSYFIRVKGVNSATNPNYLLTLSAPPELQTTGDWAENSTNIYDLKTVEGGLSLSGLSIHNNTDTDWFQFKTSTIGKEGNSVRIDFDHNLGDLDLILYDQNGTTIKGRSETTKNFEEISLKGLAAGTYKVKVLGYKNATNPNYGFSILAPDSTVNPIAPDLLEPNNSFTTALDLDLTNNISRIPGLTIHSGDTDYFKFTTTKAGTTANSISIEFEQAQGDLQLELYKAGSITAPLKFSRGTSNNETITLDGLAAGTYYAKVLGNGTATNRYQLYLDAPTDASKTKDEWTIFVYMTGSDLSESAFRDINEMELAASRLPSNVNIAVLWDQSSLQKTYATGTNLPWGDTGWAIIRPDTDADKIATTFTRIGEKNTGDPNTLSTFLNTAKLAAPANNYGLILWDHGGGDIGGFNVDNEGNRSNNTADRLYTNELVSALNTVKAGGLNLSLLAFDACLMGMTEVAYAIRNHASTFVASAESEGDTGYDYTTAFTALMGNASQVKATDLANSLIASYQQQYQGDQRNWDTLSATDTAQLTTFVTTLKSFTTAALANTTGSTWDAIHDARDAATSFFQNPNYRDLGQFLQAIATSPNTALSPLKTLAQNAYNALQNLVVNQTADRRNTEGLSIYLPDSGVLDAGYLARNTAFFAATGWNSFLSALLGRGTNNVNTLAPDWAESNEIAARAHNFNTLIGDGYAFNGLSIHKPSDLDWYRFKIQGTGTITDKVSITYANNNNQRLALSIYQQNGVGERILKQSSATGSGTETVSLSGLVTGEYWIQVTGNNIVSQYTLKFDTPSIVTNSTDWVIGNNIASKAHNLGIITARSQFSGLRVSSAEADYFEFETPKNQLVESGQIAVNVAGNQTVIAQLLSNNVIVATKTGTGNLQLTYLGEPGKTYQLKISQPNGQAAVGYSLDFQPSLLAQGRSTSSNDRVIGSSGNDNLTGLAGNDKIDGLAGNDTLNGGLGNDTMIGGLGSDVYIVDAIGDVVTETSTLATEIDTVYSLISHRLTANVERLTLTGNSAINGTGNNSNNTIVGNSAANILYGGAGLDLLTGGLGADQFKFQNKIEGIDTITDFTVGTDKITVSASGFGGGLTAGALNSTRFLKVTLGSQATTASQRFIYNSSTGGLYFDLDGSGAAAAVQFATLSSRPTLTATDFLVTV
jgi:Ca2+-binding RTX toxin-like protein